MNRGRLIRCAFLVTAVAWVLAVIVNIVMAVNGQGGTTLQIWLMGFATGCSVEAVTIDALNRHLRQA